MGATKVPIKGWIDKEDVIYIMGYYSAIKKNVAVCNNMDGPRGHYAKWNNSVRER